VVNGNGLAVDLSQLNKQELHRLWVLAVSVFAEKQVLRKLTLLVLLEIWDYAGKIHYKGMNDTYTWGLLHPRLQSPPAKMLTNMMFTVCQQLVEKLMPSRFQTFECSSEKAAQVMPGLLKSKGIQRTKATVPDDAKIELRYWAPPGKTSKQAAARVLLRNFSQKWWVYNLTREAYTWLEANGNHRDNQEGIDDCIRHAAGSNFWDWHRGSRLFFWKFPVESGWHNDARDGVEFWHLAKAPMGMHFHNIPTLSREAELQLRVKVFQLYFRWCLEKGTPDLVTL
jgi:hypothetical protein